MRLVFGIVAAAVAGLSQIASGQSPCPPGALAEGEFSCWYLFDEEDDYNGGENVIPPAYLNTGLGNEICGSFGIDPEDFARDTDWYAIYIESAQNFNLVFESDTISDVFVFPEGQTTGGYYYSGYDIQPGERIDVDISIGSPGWYTVFVAPSWSATPGICGTYYLKTGDGPGGWGSDLWTYGSVRVDETFLEGVGPIRDSGDVYVVESATPGAKQVEITPSVPWISVEPSVVELSPSVGRVALEVSVDASIIPPDPSPEFSLTFSNVADPAEVFGVRTCEYNQRDISGVVAAFLMDEDPGWDLGLGAWSFGTPLGRGNTSYGGAHADPLSGLGGPYVVGHRIDGTGNYPANRPAGEYATAGPFDCSQYSGIQLYFDYWLNVEWDDEASIEVSTDGSVWETVWANTSHIFSSNWYPANFDISSFADGASSVFVRFGQKSDGSVQLSGWNLDNVIVYGQLMAPECVADVTSVGATVPGQPGYGVPDGLVGLDDLGYFLGLWLANSAAADVTTTGATVPGQPDFGVADGTIDLDDLGYFLGSWLTGCP